MLLTWKSHHVLCISNPAGDSFVGGFFAKIILILEERKVSGVVDNYIFSLEELQEAVHAGNIMAG